LKYENEKKKRRAKETAKKPAVKETAVVEEESAPEEAPVEEPDKSADMVTEIGGEKKPEVSKPAPSKSINKTSKMKDFEKQIDELREQ